LNSAKTALTWAAAFFSLAAAALWLKATIVSVTPDPKSQDAQITETFGDGRSPVDILATAKAQTYWNKWAAIATGIATICQAIALLIP
jgi:hypothetical protein